MHEAECLQGQLTAADSCPCVRPLSLHPCGRLQNCRAHYSSDDGSGGGVGAVGACAVAACTHSLGAYHH